jgi:predicted permease
VNVGNLVTVRARGRSRELASRHALGADLGQLARQLVCENVVLSLTGGVLGIVLGVWALEWVKAIGADRLPRGFEIASDLTGALATLGLTFVIGLVLGLVPAMRLRTLDLNAELREESRGGTSGRRESLARGVMATAQFATAFVVVAGAALLLSSFMAATRVELGFEPAGVTTATVELPTPYRNPAAQSQYVRRALEVLHAMPEVQAAGVTNSVPYSGISTIVVAPETEPDKRVEPLAVTISPGYFDAMGVPVLAGRDFDRHDGMDAANVRVIIDSALARSLWPGATAVGRRLHHPADSTKLLTVIGVFGNMRFASPRIAGRAPQGTIFFTYDDRPGTTMSFVVKSKAGPNIAARVRAEMTKADPTVPVYRQRSMQDWIDLALTFRRVPMVIAVMYAVVSLILAAVGVYGVVAHGVAQRERELGVRMALGGTNAGIFRLVLGGGVRIVAIGLAMGLVGSYFVGQLMTVLLYGVAPTSVAVLLPVSAVLSAVALLATIVPAWRASRIDPVAVLNR